jgi:hypothetical protein
LGVGSRHCCVMTRPTVSDTQYGRHPWRGNCGGAQHWQWGLFSFYMSTARGFSCRCGVFSSFLDGLHMGFSWTHDTAMRQSRTVHDKFCSAWVTSNAGLIQPPFTSPILVGSISQTRHLSFPLQWFTSELGGRRKVARDSGLGVRLTV